ncbi:MAG: hypothetical protein KDG89_10830 [Geminicoccaceae bacterium]|nr:hypothetical protein [Geminicoccaceae bacterium]
MLELVIVACLLKQPGHCEGFTIPFAEPLNTMQCVFQGQLRMMEWVQKHPKWHVRRWRCEMPEA